MKIKVRYPLIAALLFSLLLPGPFLAAYTERPIRDTEAYKQFSQKPQNDFSKMIFLMNYYRDAPFSIIFDGSEYSPEFAFPFAQVYLFTHYRNEKAEKWIKKHCYRSIFGQNIIYLRFPNGRYEPARDVILRDLAQLEEALREDQETKLS